MPTPTHSPANPPAITEPKPQTVRTLALIFAILGTMVGLVVASPTLYAIFCRVTGYGGTAANTLEVYERPLDTITGLAVHPQPFQVQVQAQVSGDAPIDFVAHQRRVDGLRIGQRILLDFSVTNTSDAPILAQALHQIQPEILAPYMQVQECFCTSEQLLEPGKTYDYALVMRFDPAAAAVRNVLREQAVRVRYEYLEKS